MQEIIGYMQNLDPTLAKQPSLNLQLSSIMIRSSWLFISRAFDLGAFYKSPPPLHHPHFSLPPAHQRLSLKRRSGIVWGTGSGPATICRADCGSFYSVSKISTLLPFCPSSFSSPSLLLLRRLSFVHDYFCYQQNVVKSTLLISPQYTSRNETIVNH